MLGEVIRPIRLQESDCESASGRLDAGNLLFRVPLLRSQVLPMDGHQPLPGKKPQP